jgi:hypothetical protein
MFPPITFAVGARYPVAQEIGEKFDLQLMRLEILYGDES